MKSLILIAILIALTATQTTVTPKSQACECSNLLNLADCLALSGCTWTGNSTNTTASTGKRTCSNSTTTTPVIPSFCGSVVNSKACAGTLGCAFFNSSCQIFTGCSAYVQTTNAACQAISKQCTTDGTRCVQPSPCQTYTTQAICIGNIATSGAKQCKWTAGTGTAGTCGDMSCTDAPTTFNTLVLCQGWIINCFSTGNGCVGSLGLCSSYTGCTGMIGSDGPCTSTAIGSTACRALACTDAPTSTTLTNTACSTFPAGCVTTGKGCVSVLSACNSYAQTLGCSGLIGSDGSCRNDTTTGASNCRALLCTDAPSSTSTDAGCNTFKTGCQTTGSGCVAAKGPCSSYQGTTTTCTSLIGTDGNCKGTGSTVGPCAVKTCTDAPTTLNTNAACSTFQTGCITTGAGCVLTLGSCSTYQGTASTCTQYRGSDGNCTAPPSQTTSASCVAKVCTDAANSLITNVACQAFSYQCVSNGAGCILPGSCDTIGSALSCQGVSTCNSGSICLNRTSCSNYLTQSQCLLNQQQYVSPGTTTTYLRACTWSTTCTNKTCSAQAATLTTDAACGTALAGCVTNGAGCVDISESCSIYQGTNLTCLNFKGLNGIKVCTQLQSQTSIATCIDRTCDNSTTANGSTSTYANTSACQAYLSTCYWNGNTGCTSGGCSSYFGLQTACSSITTAGQICWQLSTVTVATTPCILKLCSHAPLTLNTDALCLTFLAGCVTNGAGCVPNTTSCTSFSGTQSKCLTLNQNTNQQCSKTANICKAKACTDPVPNPSATTCTAYINNCAFNGTSCAVAAACTSYNLTSFAACNATTDGAGKACGWAAGGTTCKEKACTDEITNPSASTCQSYIYNCAFNGTRCAAAAACTTYNLTSFEACNATSDGNFNRCGWVTGGTTCKAKACTDSIPNLNAATCTAYIYTCRFVGSACVTAGACTSYNQNNQTDCNALTDASQVQCGYQSGTTCSAKACTNTIPNPNAVTCYAYNSCAFNGTNCLVPIPSGFGSAIVCTQHIFSNFADCNKTTAATGETCGWATGGTACKPKQCTDAIPNPSATVCQAYVTNCAFNGTNCTAPASCNTYAQSSFEACGALSDGAGNRCGWVTGATMCKAKACTDTIPNPSADICQSYFSCYFVAAVCIARESTCTSYAANTFAGCIVLQSNSGSCGWTTGGTACKVKECTDPVPNPSINNCQNYDYSCLFNGTSCFTKAACNTYAATGTTDSDKANLCNSYTNNSYQQCTYISGANCSNTAACSTYTLTTFASCILRRNTSGTFCGFTAGASACSDRTCIQQLDESLCNDTWVTGCVADQVSQCNTKACNLAAISLSTNAACALYRQGCVTNGAGCVEQSALCSAYQGTLVTCQAFTGGADGLCNNVSGATSTTPCIARTCAANTTATANAVCTTWKSGCVWTGTTGCKDSSTCAGFNGTLDSCPTFTGSDGPCSGTGSTSAACISNSTICNQAPATFATHAQCQSWHTNCITNGFGCISSAGVTCNMIVSPTVCPLYKPSLSIGGSNVALGCDLASECLTKPTTCGGFSTAIPCNNVPISGSTVTCAWSTVSNSCINLTCALLPVTLTTDSGCSAALSICTTNGSGCVTKAACSTYNRIACGRAATTDTQKYCIWATPVCRPIVCSDITATSDEGCYVQFPQTGCRTNGLKCSNSLTCSSFISAPYCLKDQNNNPCLWYRGTCINYTKCTDVAATHALCQQVSPLCTTNGSTCIAITGCAITTLQVSCIVGTDGNCGWLPAAGSAVAQCALYTSCTAAQGTTTSQCLLWGSNCVSNGTSCISKTTCSAYTTQVGCGNSGTDGTCFYVTPTGTTSTGTCRLQICSDATSATATSISTHSGCIGFTTATPCTTSGTACIPQSTCGSYTVQAGCFQGTDGVCFWATSTTAATATTPAITTSVCRLKQCTDSVLTSSSSCATLLGIRCVSNGVNCIPQTACSQYTAREACLGGGSDGQCAFTPGTNTTTPNVGNCAQFTSCESANTDSVTCGSRTDACFFNSTTTNGTSSCSSHTCASKALGSSCQAVPSFDLSTYQICVLSGAICAAGNPAQLASSQCYSNSARTSTWNPTTSSCQLCQIQTATPNNTNNTNNSTNTYGYLISLYIVAAFML